MDDDHVTAPPPPMPPYVPPQVLSSEPLEFMAGTCDVQPKGKTIPGCSTLGS